MARLMIMNRVSSRLLTLGMAGVAALGLLTACAASHDNSGVPQGSGVTAPVAGMKDGITAPLPESGPTPTQVPGAPPPNAPPPGVPRDVVKTASMTITVANTSEAADKAAVLVEKVSGRVDSRSEDAGSTGGFARTSEVLRVPVAKLDEVVRDLKTLGKVQTAETKAEDVTAQRVDLDARIKALQTSVDRLLGIMRDAKDPDALINAENALSQRQADLDSLRAQRDQLGDQIQYSTIDITFVAEQLGGPAPKQYEGFTGQIERGWDGLVAVVGNLVLLFGLLLPWLGVLVVFAVILYLIARLARGRRS